jgi:hypothetical protein
MIEHTRVIFKNKFKNRKISLKKGLELIYHLPFTGCIRSDKLWWWRNYIDWIKYQAIEYPTKGNLMVARLSVSATQSNTIRIITTQQQIHTGAVNDKRKAQVLKKIFGKEKDE